LCYPSGSLISKRQIKLKSMNPTSVFKQSNPFIMTKYFYAILLSLLSYCSFGQVPVSGRVVSYDNNESLVGVNVIEKGSASNGTITDADGRYTINVSGPDAVLVFSFIGYETEEIAVGNRQTIDVTMTASLETLTEVVVTAFGIEQQRKALGYSVQEVSNKVLTEGNQPNALNALRGHLSGVNITSSSGAPGAGTTIVIRGINSLNPGANNQPLFVIDGIPVSNQTDITGGREGATFTNTNRFADINPEDIESISILKGPAASALYGLRAANGAVIVTTKSGRAGKTTYNYKTSYSFDDVYRRPPLQTKYGRGTGGLYVPNDYRADGPPIPAGEKVYDQWDELFRTSFRTTSLFPVAMTRLRFSVHWEGWTRAAYCRTRNMKEPT
jgi:TonB-dependent SusC/RagA subfamily outer membrane receptor